MGRGGNAVTEAEWMASTNPDDMLKHLGKKASKRKWRLFNCACCRRAWQLIADGRIRAIVEATERACSRPWRYKEVDAACDTARPVWLRAMSDHGSVGQAIQAAINAHLTNRLTSRTAANAVAGRKPGRHSGAKHRQERAAQAGLLRDVFGNPFRPAVPSPAWLAWNDGAVRKMAQAIYEGRFADLPILADALEDAGCTDAAILAHCRSGGEHVRGCWVVDLLLGKT
jgi:hypothetical protein